MVDEKINLEDKIVCLNQFFKPERTNYSPRECCRDCLNCTYDENNKYCKGNKPIKIKIFYVGLK